MSAPERMPILLVKSGGAQALPEWRAAFAGCAPDLGLDIRWWNDPGVDPALVEYVLVWQPEPGRLAEYPRLRAVLSSAAGVDHILADPLLPPHVPIVRMVTPETVLRMSEFTLMGSLMLLKDMPCMLAQQARRHWQECTTARTSSETRVGVMGLGSLGQAAATLHARMGFPTAGWARSPRHIEGVACCAGGEELEPFLARTDILICLLPDTAETRHIIDASLLARLPEGASVINVARGTHVHMPALRQALDTGHISAALLDVFETEPLPAEAWPWQHPRIIVTPHSAATPSRRERACQAVRSIDALRKGEVIPHIYDSARGY